MSRLDPNRAVALGKAWVLDGVAWYAPARSPIFETVSIQSFGGASYIKSFGR